MSDGDVAAIRELFRVEIRSLEGQLDRRLHALEAKLDAYTVQHQHQHDTIDQRLLSLEGQVANVQGRLLATAAIVGTLATIMATLAATVINHLWSH